MAIKRQNCINHADRAAVGVCMITKRPICAECSTRYEGVNYSREGLRILREQRGSVEKRSIRGRLVGVAAWLGAPVLLYMLYLFFIFVFRSIIDVNQAELG